MLNLLSVPPNPTIVWYFVESETMMSAEAVAPGVTKLIGDDGAREVNRLAWSEVVCHWKLQSVPEHASNNTNTQYHISAETQWAQPREGGGPG